MYNGSIPAGGVAAAGGFAGLTALDTPVVLVLTVTTLIVAATALATLLPKVRLRRRKK